MGGFDINTFFAQVVFIGGGVLIVYFLLRYLLTKKK